MNILSKILHKWFDLEPDVCPSCEVLQAELAIVRRDNEHLLYKLFENQLVKESVVNDAKDELQPIRRNQFIPARVRQQFAEENDRKSLSLMQNHKKQMEELKKNPSSVTIPENPVTKETTTAEIEAQLGIKDFEAVYDDIKKDTIKSEYDMREG